MDELDWTDTRTPRPKTTDFEILVYILMYITEWLEIRKANFAKSLFANLAQLNQIHMPLHANREVFMSGKRCTEQLKQEAIKQVVDVVTLSLDWLKTRKMGLVRRLAQIR